MCDTSYKRDPLDEWLDSAILSVLQDESEELSAEGISYSTHELISTLIKNHPTLVYELFYGVIVSGYCNDYTKDLLLDRAAKRVLNAAMITTEQVIANQLINMNQE